MAPSSRIGVDIGGTFTDFTVLHESGGVTLWKEATTPDDPARGFSAGLANLARALRLSVEELVAGAQVFVHGTTIATNAVLQRRGARVGLLCTEGFRDVLYFRDGYKRERFNLRLAHPEELVPRRLRIGVRERIGAGGEVLQALDEDGVRSAAARFAAAGVHAVAIALLWSVANPEHERRAAELLREELPGVSVIASSDVLPEIREWERTSATVLSAYVGPAITDYLTELESRLLALGLRNRLLVMCCNGGCAGVDEIVRRPVGALASGPAAAPAAALHRAAQLDATNLISVDVGGTSCDVCVVREGRAIVSREIRVADQPLGVGAVDVHSIGAGGGSVAWIDDGGALRVGPFSAGAQPGPACYGAGGERPTVTDANVVLGYLDPIAFLGGRQRLVAPLAERAIEQHVAAPLGLSVHEAAAGIRQVVDASMVGAIRAVSTERGIDPRAYTLVAGGGAGPLHASVLARSLGIERVLVPREAGTLCAFGMTVTDIRHDEVASLHQLSSKLDLERVRATCAGLEERVRQKLTASGVPGDAIELERYVDARYQGQLYELTVRVPGELRDAGLAAQLERAYHSEHERLYTFSRAELPVEVLHWRVVGVGRAQLAAGRGTALQSVPAGRGTAQNSASAERRARRQSVPADGVHQRQAYFAAGGWSTISVHEAERMPPGASLEGPAVVQAATTTILLEQADTLEVGEEGDFVLSVGQAPRRGAALAAASSGRRE
jgi:N-methylhydantoinase A